MTWLTMIFRDEMGKAIGIRGGEDGMMIGIDDVRRGDESCALMTVLLMCSENDVGSLAFNQVTFRFPDGEASEKTFTKQELKDTALKNGFLIR